MKVGDLIRLPQVSLAIAATPRLGMLGIVIGKSLPYPHQKPFVYISCSCGEIRRAQEDACEVINESR